MIQGENLRIVHKSGKLHADADALSRYPIPGGEDEIDEKPSDSIVQTDEQKTKMTELEEGLKNITLELSENQE